MTVSTTDEIKQTSEYEKMLWRAMDMLRNSLLPESQQASLLFSLLTLKKLSDSGFSGKKTFKIPKESNWEHIRQLSSNLGSSIDRAFRLIEKENQLQQFFAELPLGEMPDNSLENMIHFLSQFSLSNEKAPPHVLGDACLNHLERINQRYREIFVHSTLAELMADILDPQDGMSVYDPVCHSGELLYACINVAEKRRQNVHDIALFGEGRAIEQTRLARLLLFLRSGRVHNFASNNSLLNPAFTTDNSLLKFDRVLSAPPFGMTEWGYEYALSDKFNRFQHGVPPRTKGEMAYVQHVLSSLGPRGRASMLLPAGCLFRVGIEEGIRKSIMEFDLLEAAIALPSGALGFSNVSTSLLVFNRSKAAERKNKVLFLDAATTADAPRKKQPFSQTEAEQILHNYLEFRSQKGFSAVVDTLAIIENACDWSANRYVASAEPVHQFDLETDLSEYRLAETERQAAHEEFQKFLKQLGY